VLGHNYPIYIGFHGGRGVATSFGVFAALAMPLAVALVFLGVFIVLTLRYMSVMSIITVPVGAAIMIFLAILPGGDQYTWSKAIFGLFATFFVLYTHIPNIRRLIKGTEPKLGEGGERRGSDQPRQTSVRPGSP
jgi:glycerol-3-phosphate acyltransferase PlsY